jgi:hypothetical protein
VPVVRTVDPPVPRGPAAFAAAATAGRWLEPTGMLTHCAADGGAGWALK